MTFLIFLIVLGILVFVHELGHFLVAKKAKVLVEEFGFGYPPRALKLGRKWGTLFTLNWIPFGGFVKIVGENYEEESDRPENISSEKSSGLLANARPDFPSESFQGGRNFMEVSKKWQTVILAAGVTFNILFAWLLFSLGFMIGLPTSADNSFGTEVKNQELTIIGLTPNSPAQKSGLKTGDKIKSISLENGALLKELNPESISDFINKSEDEVNVTVDRGGKNFDFKLMPKTGIVENKKVIGINMDMIGILSLPIHKAFYEGGKATFKLTYLTIGGILNLIGDASRGEADISEVAGPVGIISLVGDASRLGFSYLLTFTALISINLAVINLVPFPALDGGRIVSVAIEGITKKKISPKVAGILNTGGFALLIIVMLIVTYRDILRLF